MRVYIDTPPHDHKPDCKACKKWLEYQKAWYFDLEHNFEHPRPAELGYINPIKH